MSLLNSLTVLTFWLTADWNYWVSVSVDAENAMKKTAKANLLLTCTENWPSMSHVLTSPRWLLATMEATMANY